jgi:simple sugar transport system permease protein
MGHLRGKLLPPALAIVFSMLLCGVALVISGANPFSAFGAMVTQVGKGSTLVDIINSTGIYYIAALAVAIGFQMNLFNIGVEGQYRVAAVVAAVVGGSIALPPGIHTLVIIIVGALAGAAWAAIPAVLRAFARTNEIITSLMLNYVAGLLLTYLIIDSHSYWRDTESFEGQTFPLGKQIPEEAMWPSASLDVAGGILVPLGFGLAVAVAVALWVAYSRTRFGFELQVIGDSQRTARFAGMRLRRKIVAVMCLSGAVAGIGGASFEGDFAYQIDPTGLQSSFYGYTGIVVAALARYNPLAVVPVGFFVGGLLNAGFTLQGADFPAGLVGVMQGLILFCALGGEVLVRYRVRFGSGEARRPQAEAPATGAAS